MTEDDKVFYPLAADSEAEMEEWTAILTRAIASEMDDTDGEGRREKSGWYFNGDKDWIIVYEHSSLAVLESFRGHAYTMLYIHLGGNLTN